LARDLATNHQALQHGTAVGATATLAIIDSGVDNEHPTLLPQIWRNPGETTGNGRDDDSNGYIDDIFGWNFAERSPLVIDRSYLGTFSPVPMRFFELQEKLLRGTITNDERDWIDEALADPANLKELQIFGNFVHGTHVAGISAAEAPASSILALKIIPTQVKLPVLGSKHWEDLQALDKNAPFQVRERLIKGLLFVLARAQGLVMTDVGRYLHRQNIQVANGSFGVSARSAEAIIVPLLKVALQRDPSPSEIAMFCDHFVSQVTIAQSVLADAAKDTLLVFAAGNDGSNNDLRPTSPANVKRDNTLSVAATFDRNNLAPFSNYGSAMVDLAAPGVAISSTSPGGGMITLSGTSQAAPYVAGIAAQIRAVNPALSPLETKTILIETAEKYDFLVDRVASGGMAHRERALLAASLSVDLPLDESIANSFATYPQGSGEAESLSSANYFGEASFVMPLPTMFSIPDDFGTAR
jgi:subtilisin family serine protease